jgi:hypothetical protein
MTREAFRWRKRGLVFQVADHQASRPWLFAFAQGPATLVLDDVVRVYFSCRPRPDDQGRFTSQTAFVDLDRADLTRVVRVAERPVMGMGGLGCFDEFGIYPFSPLQTDRELFALYGGWTRCESVPYTVAIGACRSLDGGETFERLGSGPVMGASIEDPFEISGPKLRRYGDQWHLWYVAGVRWHRSNGRAETIFKLKHAVSEDGLNWVRDGRNIVADRIGADECQASPDVVSFHGEHHMFFCYKHATDFRGNNRGYRIGYARSADLATWERDDRLAGLEPSLHGWDAQATGYPHVFCLDGKVHMLYIGNDFGREGFGLATLED